MSMIKKVGAALAATAATLTVVAATTTASAAAEPCGYHTSGGNAYYNHCATDTHVVVQVDRKFPYKGFETCYGPGNHLIGNSAIFVNAYYVGRLC